MTTIRRVTRNQYCNKTDIQTLADRFFSLMNNSLLTEEDRAKIQRIWARLTNPDVELTVENYTKLKADLIAFENAKSNSTQKAPAINRSRVVVLETYEAKSKRIQNAISEAVERGDIPQELMALNEKFNSSHFEKGVIFTEKDNLRLEALLNNEKKSNQNSKEIQFDQLWKDLKDDGLTKYIAAIADINLTISNLTICLNEMNHLVPKDLTISSDDYDDSNSDGIIKFSKNPKTILLCKFVIDNIEPTERNRNSVNHLKGLYQDAIKAGWLDSNRFNHNEATAELDLLINEIFTEFKSRYPSMYTDLRNRFGELINTISMRKELPIFKHSKSTLFIVAQDPLRAIRSELRLAFVEISKQLEGIFESVKKLDCINDFPDDIAMTQFKHLLAATYNPQLVNYFIKAADLDKSISSQLKAIDITTKRIESLRYKLVKTWDSSGPIKNDISILFYFTAIFKSYTHDVQHEKLLKKIEECQALKQKSVLKIY